MVAQPDPSTSVVALKGWRISARKRPILSDQDRDGLSHRISRYWARKGKTAASMVVVPPASTSSGGSGSNASTKEQEPPPSEYNSHSSHNNFTPLPEILFGQSFLEMAHGASGVALRFNTAGALLRWARAHVLPPDGKGRLEVLRVPEASRWAAANLAAGLKQVGGERIKACMYAGWWRSLRLIGRLSDGSTRH